MSLPFNSGYISAMALADPVDVGARLTSPDLRTHGRSGVNNFQRKQAPQVLVDISASAGAYRARRKSLFLEFGASTIVCVLVTLWIVVMQPCTMPSLRWTTSTTGARQLVVHEAAVTILSAAGSYFACDAISKQSLEAVLGAPGRAQQQVP